MKLNKWYVVEYQQGENVWYKVERVVKFLWWKKKEYARNEIHRVNYLDIARATAERDRLNNIENSSLKADSKVYIKVLEE